MKKVLMFAPTLGGGGVCGVIKNLCSSLSQDYEIDIINTGTLSEKNKLFFSNLNIKINNIDRLQNVGYFKYVKNIENIVRQNKYDIVHIHTDLIAWMVAKIARKNGVATIVGHAHGQEVTNIPKLIVKIVKKPLQFFNRKYCTDWVGCSHESIKHMFGKEGQVLINYVPWDKLVFLDGNDKIKLKKQFDINDGIIIGYAGGLSGVKNAIFAAEIYKNEDMKDYHSVFCGDLDEEVKNKFIEYKIEKFADFLGYREDMDKLYNLFDICICTSFSEGMSMGLIQAQMMGIPCVVSPGVPKVNDLGCGLFFQCATFETKEWKQKIDGARNSIGAVSSDFICKKMEENKLDEMSVKKQIISIYDK